MAPKTTLETIWYTPDDLWGKMCPLLEKEKKAGAVSRPPVPFRTCLTAFVERTLTGELTHHLGYERAI